MLDEQQNNILKPSLMAAHLGRIQRERLLVSISISGTNNIFNSMLINVDADTHTMLLDVLQPELAHLQLIRRKHFVFNVVHNGIKISFEAVVKKIVEDDGKPAYLINFPDKLIYQQRRQSFRAPISKDTIMPISLTNAGTNNNDYCEGVINNVSRGGLSLQFDQAVKFQFEEINLLLGHFHTNENTKVVCDLEIRNITTNSDYQHTTVGVQFKNLSKLNKRHIQHFALNMERRMLKRKRA